MKVIYIPVFRVAVSYTVSFGRRWSVLEHLLLSRLSKSKGSLAELSEAANLPERLVVEALINLLRANWIEARSGDRVLFQATAIGKKRADESTLPPQVHSSVKWISLCVDRLTGAWFRAEDLELVYEKHLPEEAFTVSAKMHTYDHADGRIRELFRLALDETLEPVEPQFRNASRPFARVVVAFDQIESGLPANAPLSLINAVVEAAGQDDTQSKDASVRRRIESTTELVAADTLDSDNFIVGGAAHRHLVREILEHAKSRVIIHSCFIAPDAIEGLLPDFESAAKRNVKIDLLWGLHYDPESNAPRSAVVGSRGVLNRLGPELSRYVQLSPLSSGSHAKIVIADSKVSPRWSAVISSCNFLQSQFTSLDVSVQLNSQRLVTSLLGRLIAAQLPASGSWSPVARRLNSDWDQLRKGMSAEDGKHRLTLLMDQDHYACVRMARDASERSIVLGCDIYGLASETSVLVPMERAAELGKDVRLIYQRPSKLLAETGRLPDAETAAKRGISLEVADGLHGKFLLWDESHAALSSFNWLSTVVDGTRARGAEIGVRIDGPEVRSWIAGKMMLASSGRVDLRIDHSRQGKLQLAMPSPASA